MYEESVCHLLVSFPNKQCEAVDHTFTFTQETIHSHTHYAEKKKGICRKIQLNNKKSCEWISFRVHSLGSLMVSTFSHKPILPQQMHSAVHIIIMHLNILHVTARNIEPNMCSWIFTREKGIVKKKYKRICSYIIHRKCISMLSFSLSFSCLSLSHVGGSTGHPAMPHQYAYWWNASPASPPCCSCRGLQQWKWWLMSPDTAGHVSW